MFAVAIVAFFVAFLDAFIHKKNHEGEIFCENICIIAI